eukprot:scaffold32506_cov112-Isochrysis_galbana.AAC.4
MFCVLPGARAGARSQGGEVYSASLQPGVWRQDREGENRDRRHRQYIDRRAKRTAGRRRTTVAHDTAKTHRSPSSRARPAQTTGALQHRRTMAHRHLLTPLSNTPTLLIPESHSSPHVLIRLLLVTRHSSFTVGMNQDGQPAGQHATAMI